MIIRKLTIKNFRCFENLECTLNDKLTVFVGKNGAGKSSILDALAIAVSTFLCGIDGGQSRNIQKADSHYRFYQYGDITDPQHQFPVEIQCEGVCDGECIPWKRSLNSSSGNTTIKDAKQLVKIAERMQNSLMIGKEGVILPILSYYGTGRLYAQKKEKKNTANLQMFNRQVGYLDCMDAASNEKLMLNWFQKMTLKELKEQQKYGLTHSVIQLRIVEQAVCHCFEKFSNNIKSHILFDLDTHQLIIEYIDPDGLACKLALNELSDGYKNTLSMIADIAYRMAVLNPQFEKDVLQKTPGIILIDEIDLHLHPEWQQKILNELTSLFPNVQFFVSSHAPAVINSVKDDNVQILENGKIYSPAVKTYGRDVNSILREIMGVEERPAAIQKLLAEFYHCIDMKELGEAENLLKKLTQILGDTDSELSGANITLDFEKMQEEFL